VLASFLRDWLSILAAGLVFSGFIQFKAWALLVAFVAHALVWSGLQCGYLRLCLNLRKNNQVRWSDLFSGFPRTIQMLLATVLFWMAIVLGCVLLIVPGVIIFVRCSLYAITLADQEVGPLRSLTSSYGMVKRHVWLAAGLASVSLLGGLIVWVRYLCEALFILSLCSLYEHLKSAEAVE
jgi:uncharacterized membrane protein